MSNSNMFDLAKCHVLENLATPPSPVQAGVATNCNRWMKPTTTSPAVTSPSASTSASPPVSSAAAAITTTTTSPRPPPSSTSLPAASTTPSAGEVTAPEGATYLGCASEVPARVLNQLTTSGDDMTIDKCLAFCAGARLPLAGLEYGRECYCGTSLTPPSALGSPDACRMRCAGNKDQVCGGPGLLSVFRNNTIVAATAPQKVTGKDGGVFEYQGCYDESKGRVLPNDMFGNDTLTVGKCVAFCEGKGYGLAGVEYGRECWCGKAIKEGTAKLDDGRCGMLCTGDGSQLCGGSRAIGIYKKSGGKNQRDVSQEGEAAVTIEKRGKGDGHDNTDSALEVESPPPPPLQTVVKTVRLVRRGRWGGRRGHGMI
ncbi:hypothetical protein PG993_001776 [Apiospora rasikravindrae]|uniref:WSC domain-containing protein n=1 Tax=Apiospora rasikravindrae TaxID=990691 RepID=A0ABR1UCB7_9PEZI